MQNLLLTELEFKVPDAVVCSALKKFCTKEDGKFTPKQDMLNSSEENKQQFEELSQSNENIINKLIEYVEQQTKQKLGYEEKNKLTQDFCKYMIEDFSESSNNTLISAFILNSKKNDLTQQLNTIKEGVILYTGFAYNDNLNNTGSWRNEYSFYLEQELLFDLAGYNGELFQTLFKDFLAIIKEINTKNQTRPIQLKYHSLVKTNIDKFFAVAEDIVLKRQNLDFSNQAMTLIVNGCDSISQIAEKKVAFLKLLEKNGICEETRDFYLKEEYGYNIEDTTIKESIENELQSQNIQSKDVEQSLKLLNYINIERKGSYSNFEQSKCILITRNSTTRYIAFNPNIKKKGDVPLATSLDFVTNRLWCKLNKGFGNSNSYPKSFSVVTKAQIILASKVTDSVVKEFEKIKNDTSKDRDSCIKEISELKKRIYKPEEICEANVDTLLNIIEICDVEKFTKEHDLIVQEKERLEKKTEDLLCEKQEMQNEIKERERDLCNQQCKNDEMAQKLVEMYMEKINVIEEQKKKVDKKINGWFVFFCVLQVLIIVALTCFVVFSLYKYIPSDICQAIKIVFVVSISLIEIAIYTIWHKKISKNKIFSYLPDKFKQWKQKREYKKRGVNIEKLEGLKDELKRYEINIY